MAKQTWPVKLSFVILCAVFMVLSIMRSPPSFPLAATTLLSKTNVTALQLADHFDPLEERDFMDFMQGPGLFPHVRNQSSMAVCEFFQTRVTHMIPHAMEQLYRCWSWFVNNPGKQPILVHPVNHVGFPHQWTLNPLTWTTKHDNNDDKPTQFTHAMVHVIQHHLHVKLTSHLSRYQNVAVRDFRFMFGFHTPQDARSLTAAIVTTYDLPSDKVAGCLAASPTTRTTTQTNARTNPPLPRIAILNRDGTRGMSRCLWQADEIVREIEHKLYQDQQKVPVVYFEDANFTEQVQFFRSVDILISPHGAQLTGIPFMPTCGKLIEIFPFRYYWPAYYGGLARQVGLEYQALYASDSNYTADEQYMALEIHREVYRNQHFHINDTRVLLRSVQSMMEQWYKCCQSQQEQRP